MREYVAKPKRYKLNSFDVKPVAPGQYIIVFTEWALMVPGEDVTSHYALTFDGNEWEDHNLKFLQTCAIPGTLLWMSKESVD